MLEDSSEAEALEVWWQLPDEELLPPLPSVVRGIDCSARQNSDNAGNLEQLVGRIQEARVMANWGLQVLSGFSAHPESFLTPCASHSSLFF